MWYWFLKTYYLLRMPVVYVTKGTGESGGDPAVGEMEWKVVVAGSANARGEGQQYWLYFQGVAGMLL